MNKRLLNVLNELHAELRRMDSLDSHDRELVEHLQNDIQALMTKSKPEYHSLRARLQEAIDRFEVTHPELTVLMSRAVDSLSTMGI